MCKKKKVAAPVIEDPREAKRQHQKAVFMDAANDGDEEPLIKIYESENKDIEDKRKLLTDAND